MWESEMPSWGCTLMYALWAVTFVFILVGWAVDEVFLGMLGCASSAGAASLTVMKDNQATRRATRNAFELGRDSVTPMR